jgi:hypothetical protein
MKGYKQQHNLLFKVGTLKGIRSKMIQSSKDAMEQAKEKMTSPFR